MWYLWFKNRVTGVLFIGSVLLCLAACSQRKDTGSERCVTVSIEPLRCVTEQLVGDLYVVQTLVPGGGNPETYEPTPAQMMNLSRSTLYVACGDLGFEREWLGRLQTQAEQTVFVAAADKLTLLPSSHHHSDTSGAGEQSGDPHVWTSPRNMAVMARCICDALCRMDTTSAPVFQANLHGFLSRTQQLNDSISRLLADKQGSVFLIYHPTLTYFARDYGLTQLAIESDGKEPSAARLRELIDRCRMSGVRTVFVQKEFDRRHADLIAGEIGARVVEINPLSYHWDEEMLHIAEVLKNE
ncbi:MAG: zinc ABC transporter substrate-binding protein [Clostridium sp.]|nr:zinc ABC transporter substrate-binding protein [Clostridium sp.]